MMSLFKSWLKSGLIGTVAMVTLAQTPVRAADTQAAQIGRPPVVEHVSACRQVIEIDMAALADPAPRPAAPRLAAAPVAPTAAAESAATATGTSVPRKRFAHKVGQYEDAPLIALLAQTN